MSTTVITLQGGPADGKTMEVEGRPAEAVYVGRFKGVLVHHRYKRLTSRMRAAVVIYRYVETVVADPDVARPT